MAVRQARRSGLQLRVLSLYREFLRESKKLEDSGAQKKFQAHVRTQFEKSTKSVAPSQFDQIEYLIRTGYKKLDIVRSPGFRGLV
mmetsp:Transcript_4522/g.7918  ORF Transcript_4522/g.7918 Transcript_4522/m.7918 type:complete len:85 (-) Transcript_4522:604-858(-)